MLRRPPSSTLFPSRRSSDLQAVGPLLRPASEQPGDYDHPHRAADASMRYISAVRVTVLRFRRSEEHTSELQSRRDLVCRLLLEKKKNKYIKKCRKAAITKQN